MALPLAVLSRLSLAVTVFTIACGDDPTAAVRPQASAVTFWDALASTRWIERTNDLLTLRPQLNGQGAANRILAYVAVAQYRAVLAAEGGKDGSTRPSVSAAVAAASTVVLSRFFPLDSADVEAQLDQDLATPGWPGDDQQDAVSGEAIGRDVGAAVLALAGSDNYLSTPVPAAPPGIGIWVSSGAPTVPALHGVRPFFLSAPDAIRPPAPPAFGSPAFLAAVGEIRTLSDTRTPAQLALAQEWNVVTGPYTAGALNRIAIELIVRHRRTEREATRILAYANAAAFDAHIACWDAKTYFWVPRPSQADPAITLPIGLPNHPSYPSGHSCLTGGILNVLIDAFPGERARLEQVIEDAGLSRMYGGIHYRFDVEAGAEIGRRAAALALRGSLE